ncbi:hypothetical protein L596_028496 [Steinernema carpocapsae]|uniref:WD repeat-containing protein 74 n=1 Tax=Steinernema carpocapsae TaxID=34508 RepID=A0A4U5LYK9_STECR|nr:hypothetical protein L596_028496 [Steinernema carpocapsae]
MDCYVGAATGALKGLVLRDGTFMNVNNIPDLKPKEDEITRMCFADVEQVEILTGHANRQVKLFDTLVASHNKLFEVQGGSGPIQGLQMTSNGNIVAGVESGEVMVYESDGTLVSSDIKAGEDLRIVAKNPMAEQIATGGKKELLRIWDLETQKETWKAKNVKPDWLQIPIPIWVSNARYLDDNGLIVTTTGRYQIHVYDPRAQRRPVKELEWLDMPIHALSTTYKPMHIMAGNTKGELAQFDLRNKITALGKYRGFAGSIRSIDCHPSSPYAVSCGIDRFVILHDMETRKIVKKIYCKARLNQLVMKKALSLLDNAPKAPKRELDSDEEDDEDEFSGMKKIKEEF